MEVNSEAAAEDAVESGDAGSDAPAAIEPENDSEAKKQETADGTEGDTTPAAEPVPAEPEKITASADLIEDVKKPISADAPCGDDASYDDDFQRVKSGIEQATLISGHIDHEKAGAGRDKKDKGSIVGTTEVDYGAIARESRSLLTSKTKDLRLASYLTIGLYHTQKLTGLLDGLSAIHALGATFWDDLHPKRPRARRAAIDLMVSRVGEPLEGYKPGTNDGPVLDAILEELTAAQTFLTESLGQNAPVLSGLKAKLTTARRRVPAVKKAEPKPSAQRPASAGAGPARAGEAPAQEIRNPADARRRAVKAADFMRAADKKNPLPYRMARVVRWSEITALPPNESGKTPIEEPDATKRLYLEDLFGKGVFETLLEQCELVFNEPGFFLWLNLQRIQATAAAALGEPYANVHEAIILETAALVRRVPGLLDLKFIDGKTPFADPLTRDWIETTVLSSFGSGSGSGSGQGQAESLIEERFQEARKLLGKGDLKGALSAMDEIGGVDSDEKRFRIRFYRALLCVKGGQSSIACPILESLDGEVDRRGLADWDPKLALEVWAELYRCYENMSSVPGIDLVDLKSRAKNIYSKICEVDAASAFAFTAL